MSIARRGDTSTNVVIFIMVFIIAIVLVTWYVQTIQPTRYIIGAATEDLQEMQQHLANACAADVYSARYLFATGTGFFESNGSAFCLYTEVYGGCRPVPCAEVPRVRFPLGEDALVVIERNGTQMNISPSR